MVYHTQGVVAKMRVANATDVLICLKLLKKRKNGSLAKCTYNKNKLSSKKQYLLNFVFILIEYFLIILKFYFFSISSRNLSYIVVFCRSMSKIGFLKIPYIWEKL